MKVAIYNVTTGLQLGGIEIYCVEMAKELSRLGHEVSLIAGHSEKSVNIDGCITLSFPFTPRHRFRDFGVRYRKLMERLSFARHAYSHLHSHDYDAIIITKPYDFPLAWRLKMAGFKGRIIFHTGGTDFFFSDRFFFRAIDYAAACSRYTAALNEARYRKPFQIIYNGVDTDHFKPLARDSQWRHTLNIPDDAVVVMTVGRLVGWKGLDTLVRAIVGLENIHYVYVGEGPYGETLSSLARQLGISHRVHAAGSQPHHHVPVIMNEADIFAQPSIGEEAFGITVIEAMACALPVLASAQGGMLEIIEHESDGLLLPPGDIAIWRQTISTLANNGNLRKRLGTAARASAHRRFSWQASAIQLSDMLYKENHNEYFKDH